MSGSGKARLEFWRRLRGSWRDLADYLDVPASEQDRWPAGEQPRRLWEWLADRDRLSALPEALAGIGRADLLGVATTASGGSGDAGVRPAAGRDGLGTVSPVLATVLRAQVRAADELPYQLFGPRRPTLSAVYVRERVTLPGVAAAGHRQLDAVLAAHRHVLLVGGPGHGKSTLTLRLAGRLAEAWLGRAPADGLPPVLPLRVPARALAAARNVPWSRAVARAAVEELGQYLDNAVPEQFLEAPVGGVPWLYLVDGVDEVADPQARASLLAVLRSRMDDRATADRLLVTSRPFAPAELSIVDGSPERCGHYVLEPFDMSALETFAGRWFGSTSAADNPTAERFLAELRRSALLDEARVPLLAAVAAVVFEDEHELPAYRHRLFERYLRCQSTRHATAGGGALRARLMATGGAALTEWLLDPQRRDELIGHLAVTATDSDRSLVEAALDWIAAHGPAVRRSPADWRLVVEDVVVGTGLLVRRGGTVEFVHHSFAEHLAAEQHALALPAAFDPDEPSWSGWIGAAVAGGTSQVPQAVLMQAAIRDTAVATRLIDHLQAGATSARYLAAVLIADGAHAQPHQMAEACRAVEYDVALTLDGGMPGVELLGRLTGRTEHAISALRSLADNRCASSWVRAEAMVRLATLPRHGTRAKSTQLRALARDPVGDGFVRAYAGRELAMLGTAHAADAVAALRPVLTDPYAHMNARASAAAALADLGPERRREALAVLNAVATDPCAPPGTRLHAGYGLEWIGGEATDAAAATFAGLLTDPETVTGVRVWAAVATARVRPERRDDMVDLLRSLLDGSTYDRCLAAFAMVRIGAELRGTAGPQLCRVLAADDADGMYWQAAAEVLGGTADPWRASAIDILRGRLARRDVSGSRRYWAAAALAQLGHEFQDELVDALRPDGDVGNRIWCARGIAHISPLRRARGHAILRAVAEDPDVGIALRVDAASWLGEGGTALLLDLAASAGTDAALRYRAVRAVLEWNREPVPELVSHLRAVMADPAAGTRCRADAADTLAGLGPQYRDEAADCLRGEASDPAAEESERRHAARHLAKTGPGAHEEAVRLLQRVRGG